MNDIPASRPVEEHLFTSHDGVELFYRYWPAITVKPKGATVIFHRGHEHSGRVTHIVDELRQPDFAFFAWDARGHGRSPGERGYSPSLAASVRDVHSFIQHIVAKHHVAERDIAVIAQSVGAVLVATWVHDYAPKIRCMVLASPAFKVKLYVPFARSGIKAMQALRGPFFVNSYVKAKFLSHDPARIASYDADPLITRPIASHILLSLYQTAERIVDDAVAITVPTQLFISAADWVVHHEPQHRFYARLGSDVKERHILPGFYHDTFGEKERAPVLEKVANFIQQRFAEPYHRPDMSSADKVGFFRYEADTLASPLSRLSPRGMYWTFNRLGLKVGAVLSQGVELGFKTGFDSGSTLDYVYENQPRGWTALGQFIDKNYLNAIGWRGIRQRKIHIEEMLHVAMTKLRQHGQPVHVMDVASGHGRYILDAIAAAEVKPDSVLLRDYSDLNVQQGTKLIQEKGLQSIARFINANAFAADSYQAISPAPSLSVVSGLYELFADNDLIRCSLNGLSASMQQGAYLIYTGQPWHPQLEMIARALSSHRNGQAWVMRRRSQEEMDQLVEQAGFSKVDQRIDEFGIFTVSLARKNPT